MLHTCRIYIKYILHFYPLNNLECLLMEHQKVPSSKKPGLKIIIHKAQGSLNLDSYLILECLSASLSDPFLKYMLTLFSQMTHKPNLALSYFHFYTYRGMMERICHP